MIAAAGLLAARTGEIEYSKWYNSAWEYCTAHFVDGDRGGWYPVLSPENQRVDPHMPTALKGKDGVLPVKSYPSKTDYHPITACYAVLQAFR